MDVHYHEDNSTTITPLLTIDDAPKLGGISFDDTIETLIGDFGWAQLLHSSLVSFACFFDAQQIFVTVFADAAPSWSLKSTHHDPDICRLPADAWAWDAPAAASTVSDFSLICSGAAVAGLPASSFFAGCLVGGLALATLGDSSLGRRRMLSSSCLAMGLAAFLTALFASNVWSYSLLRFTAGLGRSTIGASALVLATELVGKRWRGRVSVAGFIFFMLGFLSLPAMAYANQNHFNNSWRNLYVWTSVPTIIYSVIVHFFVHESPRWLFVQGRREEAIATLDKISCSNNNNKTHTGVHVNEEKSRSSDVDLFSAFKILVEKRWALRRLAAMSAVGFGIGLVYYGMPMALGGMELDLYVSVTLNALSELPASLVTLFLVGRFNRRSSLLFLTSMSGVCSVVLAVLKRRVVLARLHVGLELASFFSAGTAFDLMLIFSTELFPTCVRNSAVSLVRQAAVLGGVFGPVLAAAGGGGGYLSYSVFGVVVGCCGLGVICLPETRGRGICDTMDEDEKKDSVLTDDCRRICC